MTTQREVRIAEETVSAIDYMSRLLGAIETGNWHYALDKKRQLSNTLASLDQELARKDQPADGKPIAAYVAEHSRQYRIGKALYGARIPASGEAEIAPEVAAHVLFHLGEGGWPTSGFRTALMKAIATADAPNREVLARAFPDYVKAFNLAQYTQYGTAELQKIAAQEGAR